MRRRYQGAHVRRTSHRAAPSRARRRAGLLLAALGLLAGATATVGLTGGLPTLGTPEETFPVRAAAAIGFTYDAGAYRRALQDDLGNPLSDAAFTDFEQVAQRICGWDEESFAGWVAMNADDGTLNSVDLDVRYRCPQRTPEITDALRLITSARTSCVLPENTSPEVRALVAGRPAQQALTCVYLNREFAPD